jgi:excisionase family DNA binding protein
MTTAAQHARLGDWLTPEDIADELQIPLRTLYSWRARRLGPEAIRIGRHLRYSRQEIDRWLDEQIKRQQSKESA